MYGLLTEITKGKCKHCGAELRFKTNDGDYEGPCYWVGGEYGCLHVVDGCEFEDIVYPEEHKMITMERVARLAGLNQVSHVEGDSHVSSDFNQNKV